MSGELTAGVLGDISLGTALAWLAAIATCLTGLWKVGRELYHAIRLIRDVVEKNDAQEGKLQAVQEACTEMAKEIRGIVSAMEEERAQKLAEQRHLLVKAGEEYLERGWIRVRELRALNEVFEQYQKPDKNGVVHNGYVATLIRKVNALPVHGRLDEHGEDIPEGQEECSDGKL